MNARRRVTISLASDTLRYVDRQVGKRARSRSAVILDSTDEESRERDQWLEMSLETQRYDR